MQIALLDLEGVLFPEIWISLAERTGIDSLKRTTRDEPDYAKLMQERLETLRKHGLGIADIRRVIATLQPLEGARSFLDSLRREVQVIIASDTFYQFAGPIMESLGMPTLFCNELDIDETGNILGFVLRQENGKSEAVRALQSLNFTVVACGDSYNDCGMIQVANRGCFFRPPASIRREYQHYPAFSSYEELLGFICG